MKRILYIIIILLANILSVNANIDSKASKMFFLNSEIGIIIIGEDEIILTNDGCNSWTTIKIDTQEKLHKVLFSPNDVGWLIGDSSIFKSIDGGYTWHKNITFKTSRLHTLFFIDENKGFLGGEIVDEQGVDILLYNTTNCGDTWERSVVDSVLENGILNFSFVHDSIGIAVGYNTLYKTYDFGKNWNKLPTNFFVGGFMPEAAQMIDENNILLFGGAPNVVWDGEVIMSNDGGLSWNEYGKWQTFEWGISDFFVSNLDSVWITNGVNMFRTTNRGEFWETNDIKVEEFSFFTNNRAYGFAENSILSTENGWESYTIIDSVLVNVEMNKGIDNIFQLDQNYPNPFNPATTIKYSIDRGNANFAYSTKVQIKIYDILGREVATLVNESKQPGTYEVEFNSENISSGIYYYSLVIGSFSQTKKMILLK